MHKYTNCNCCQENLNKSKIWFCVCHFAFYHSHCRLSMSVDETFRSEWMFDSAWLMTLWNIICLEQHKLSTTKMELNTGLIWWIPKGMVPKFFSNAQTSYVGWGVVKLLLVGGVNKPPKLENVGQKFHPRGFEEGTRMAAGGTLNGSKEGNACCCTLLPFEVPPLNPGEQIFDQNCQV